MIDGNEKDPDKSRGRVYCSFLCISLASLDLFTEQEEKNNSNHAVSPWTVACKPLALILFSHARTQKKDTNSSGHFALLNNCNPAAEKGWWYQGII